MSQKNTNLEGILKYRHTIYAKIDDLILEQKSCLDFEGDIVDVERFLDIQTKINDLYSITQKSTEQAMLKICTQELMYANQSKDNRRSESMKDYVMITINPMTTVSVDCLVKAVTNFMKSSFVDYGMYVFEQRSPDANWYGYHSHILIKRSRRPSAVKDGIRRILRPLVGNENAIKIKSQSDLKDVQNYIGYMRGKKKDVTKKPLIEQTILWRESLGLESIYTVGTIPLLVGMVPVV